MGGFTQHYSPSLITDQAHCLRTSRLALPHDIAAAHGTPETSGFQQFADAWRHPVCAAGADARRVLGSILLSPLGCLSVL